MSSYKRLKEKKDKAEKIAAELIEDIEFVILYPHSSRAKSIRREVKDKHNE